ncbi:MAG TPA: DoxX family protein [Vicinamibacterales bacterium]|nr:DoxX family protein [Vicinamibacterales bacterium]
MNRLLGRFEPAAYAAMRIVLAFLYWSHGVRWLFGAFGGHPARVLTLVWVAGVIETICGTLMGLGLWTSCAAFVASGEMAVAYFMVHNPRGPVPLQNGGEVTVALCFGFLYLATRGSGAFSVDRFRRKR